MQKGLVVQGDGSWKEAPVVVLVTVELVQSITESSLLFDSRGCEMFSIMHNRMCSMLITTTSKAPGGCTLMQIKVLSLPLNVERVSAPQTETGRWFHWRGA